MGETVHSKIGASSMHRWAECPGSVRLSEGLGSVQSEYAKEGTRAHEVAETVLRNAFQWPADLEVSDEMEEAVRVYTQFVAQESKDPGAQVLIEHKFDLSSLHPGLFGTADCVIYHPETKLLQVIDYKHGSGVVVEVINNKQLMYYGLGALLSLKFPVKEVELVIVQPRAYHADGPVRRWALSSFELLDFAADLVQAAKATEDPFAPLNPGDHCRFCPASAICPSIHEKTQELAKVEFAKAGPMTSSFDKERLAEVLEWLPRVEAWVKSVREYAYGEATMGRVPPGWKLVSKRATRRWKDEASAITELRDRFKIEDEDMFKKTLLSPAQMEKLVPKKQLEHLVVAVSSGVNLVPESHPGQPVLMDPKHDFEKVPDTTTADLFS